MYKLQKVLAVFMGTNLFCNSVESILEVILSLLFVFDAKLSIHTQTIVHIQRRNYVNFCAAHIVMVLLRK